MKRMGLVFWLLALFPPVLCIFWTIVGTDSDASWAVILIDRGH
ncbi:hypothetical protein ACQAYK_11070 [Acidithiobacillus sp. AC3]